MAESIHLMNPTGRPYGVKQLDDTKGSAGENIPLFALSDADGNTVSPQFPVPTDGDSVYAKDIDVDLSDIGTFTGDIHSLVNDYTIDITDATATNPKSFTLRMYRPTTTSSFGIGSTSGDFSNVKITFKDLAGVARLTVDDSANSTKYTSNVYKFSPITFIEVVVEFYTADAVSISGLFIPKDVPVVSRIQGVSDANGLVEGVSTFRGALSTTDGLRHRTGLNLKFHQPDTVSTTLAVATAPGDTSITVVDATGFTIGMDIEIYSGAATGELFFKITALPGGNVLVLDQPIPLSLDIGNAVENTLTNMNVLGTLASPQIFYIGPPAGSIWQLTRLLISMTDATAMDDGTFGGVTALTNGVVIRQYTNGEYGNATIWKTNGDIASDMYDTSYVAKPPAGTGYGFRARWTLQAMQAVVELNGDTGDQLQILIQDDLTGLVSFVMKCQGRLYGG